jgi:hypothetical protein
VEKQTPGEIPNKAAFDSLMEPNKPSLEGVSPMDLSAQKQITPTFDSVLNQINQTTNLQNDIREKLGTPNLTLKNSQQKLLNSKLSESINHLQNAAEYMGAPKITPTKTPSGSDPVAKFLGYLTDGQNQLLQTKKTLEDIQAKGGDMKPSQMMLVQVNLSQAQQEIEFSSVLLSKVVDALKQTLSIQL